MRAKPLSKLSALVLDAQDSHSLSAIRSLGWQGADVTAVSPKPQAMGTVSRYCRRALRSPSPSTEPERYAEWLLGTLKAERFDGLLFFGEASANVVAAHRDAIQALTGCLVAEHDTFMTADRKDRITRLATSIGVPVPATYEIETADAALSLLPQLVFPVIVKAVWGSGGHQVRFVSNGDAFIDTVRDLSAPTPDGTPQRCLVQEFIPGTGYGFTALAAEGEVIASFMHRRLAEHDVMRGAQLAHAATGAESVDEPELRASGTALLRALRWDGMAMVEFRRSSRDGRFYLMEVNPRFPGSLNLAIAAGVDFPSLYLQRAAGRAVQGPSGYRLGLRYRWILSKGVAEAVEDPKGYMRSAASLLRTDTRCDVSLRDPKPHLVQVREAAWWLRQHARQNAASGNGHGSKRGSSMGWRNRLRSARAWLVRDRSYLPVAFFSVVLAAMQGFTYPRGDHRLDLAWEGLCLLVGLLGLAVRAASDGFESRGGGAATGESLRTTGLYSIMRHPRKFGTLLLWLGIAMFPRMPWIPVLAIVAFWVYNEPRMSADDENLRRRFPRSYPSWAAVTPMFLPRLWLWKRPHGNFALVPTLRREHTALFLFVTALTVLEVAGDLNITSHFGLDREWGGLFGANAAMYATLSVLNLRRTPPSSS